MSEDDWVRSETARLTAEHGAVPPPWVAFPDRHPHSIGWRMGDGEDYLILWHAWWGGRGWGEADRLAYFRRWPPPPRWLAWMIDAVWGTGPSEDGGERHRARHFPRAEALGFGARAEYERDLHDPRWLRGSGGERAPGRPRSVGPRSGRGHRLALAGPPARRLRPDVGILLYSGACWSIR